MAKTGNYIQRATFTGTVNIANAFANRIDLELVDRRLIHSAIFVNVNTIAAGAANLIVRVTTDAAGDFSIVPDTAAPISTGITVATNGSCVWKVDIAIPVDEKNIYVWLATDAGTCVAESVTLSAWE